MVGALQDHLGFVLRMSQVNNAVFVPRYYDPEIADRLMSLETTHNLIVLGDLKRDGSLFVDTGHEIGKMAYGTGEIPFIRTSDMANWELKADPKQGVGEGIYAEYSVRQDVQAGDIFFVRDGTYLIGQTCLLTPQDMPCLYQSHILKFRVKNEGPIPPALLLACLNAPIVKRQIRAKQFTADIIDTIGNRYLELVLPVPKDADRREAIIKEVDANIASRVELRGRIRRIPLWLEGHIDSLEESVPVDWEWRFEQTGHTGFACNMSQMRNGIFVPKYYDPQIENDLRALASTHDLTTLAEWVQSKTIAWDTGVEIGKMAYGTGPIPFVRTSDISNWELKGDPKQNVSVDIYKENRQDVQAEDIFVVRDGTYLVGTSCILTEHDTQILYCGGIYKLRVHDKKKLDPYLLLALLNAPTVRRQMRAKQFTRDIIDTLGKRLFEIVLPVPKDAKKRRAIAEETRRVIETRVALRNRAKQIALEVEGIEQPKDDDLETLADI